jgi:hypothetical protein
LAALIVCEKKAAAEPEGNTMAAYQIFAWIYLP